MPEARFELHDCWDNGEFLTGATLVCFLGGEEVHRETFLGSTEEPPGHTGPEMAASAGVAWCEIENVGLEELLRPWGIEWAREREEEGVPF